MTRNACGQTKRPKLTRSAKVLYPADSLGKRARAAMRAWVETLPKRKRRQIEGLSK